MSKSKTGEKPKPQLRLLRKGDRVTVHFLDPHICGDVCIRQFRKGVDKIIQSVPEARVEIDMSNVEYISSAALGELMSARIKLSHANCDLRLLDPREEVREIFAVTRLDNVFAIA